MPRRPKPEDIDFEIHVDPSCLSAPRDEFEDEAAMSGKPSLPDEGLATVDAIEALESEIREQLDHALDKSVTQDDTDSPDSKDATESSTHDVPSGLDEASGQTDSDVTPTGETSMVSGHALEDDSVLSTDKQDEPSFSAEAAESDVVMQSIEGDSLVESNGDQEHRDSLLAEENTDIEGHDSRLQTPDPDSRRESYLSNTSAASSPRRGSGRTEALIQAAARNIVAQIEQGEDVQSVDDNETSFISETETVERSRNSEAYTMDESRRSSGTGETEQARSADEGADSSSHHENEDDVFSDHSPRSSVGSASEAAASDAEERKTVDNVTRRSRTRSPRMSGVSGFSQYDQDEDEFVPTVRGTPRPAFRSPSSVKAMQMSSPPASVFGSPRSSRRTPLPTVSRLGSPGISAQYSPKKTPPRFKRNTPPLVLLHVTLLPLRWPWGDVLDDATEDDLSPDGKNLRDAWRQLQDRMGDTTCERGILLPHPQNDYEVLEERLLEALELPMRRRARILECGHYLGPANEMTLLDDMDDSDEEFDEDANVVIHSPGVKTHWCSTCRSDIRYDSLGAGKVFRVKVYASNGLMKAGAWDTCWKEMERVDVEIEPLVDVGVQHELSRLQTEQERRIDEEHALELRRSLAHDDDDYAHTAEEHDEPAEMEPEPSYQHNVETQESTSPHLAPEDVPPPSSPEESRRLRDEERLREIYGQSPPATHPEADSPDPSFTAHGSPASPSVEAFERRQERARSNAAQAYKTASLPELLLESVRVLFQDRKNVVILVMGVLVALLALRSPTGATQVVDSAAEIERLMERREAIVVPSQEASTAAFEGTVAAEPVQASVQPDEPAVQESQDPCSSAASNAEGASVVQEVVRVVETVTETAVETATVTQTFTAVETESRVPEEPQASSEASSDAKADVDSDADAEADSTGQSAESEIESGEEDDREL